MNTQLGKRLIRLLFAIVGGSVGIYTLPFFMASTQRTRSVF